MEQDEIKELCHSLIKKYDEDEIYHHGVPGMKWGHRKAVQIQGRKDKALQKYKEIQQKNPNSKKAVKAKIKSDKINASKYGKTSKQIVGEGVMKHIGSLGLQTAAATALIASGAIATAPALAAIGSVAISAGGAMYRGGNAVSTIFKTYSNNKSIKQNMKK